MEEEHAEFRTLLLEERVMSMHEDCDSDLQLTQPPSKKAAKGRNSAPLKKSLTVSYLCSMHFVIQYIYSTLHHQDCNPKQVDICSVLESSVKEEGVTEQPLYIDAEEGVIRCRWCGDLYKGSAELKHVNQYVKKAASHIGARKKNTMELQVKTFQILGNIFLHRIIN